MIKIFFFNLASVIS